MSRDGADGNGGRTFQELEREVEELRIAKRHVEMVLDELQDKYDRAFEAWCKAHVDAHGYTRGGRKLRPSPSLAAVRANQGDADDV